MSYCIYFLTDKSIEHVTNHLLDWELLNQPDGLSAMVSTPEKFMKKHWSQAETKVYLGEMSNSSLPTESFKKNHEMMKEAFGEIRYLKKYPCLGESIFTEEPKELRQPF